MDVNLINEIINKIQKFEKIAIYRHVFPDPDSYGSSIALKELINNTFPEKQVVLLGEHNSALEYIGKTDNPGDMEIDKDTLAIILDVSNKERVDNQSFFKCGYIIKIDHHKPFDKPFENLTWVDTEYSSCSEMILDLYINSDYKLNISKKGRRALFSGIIGDTGRFEYLDNATELFKKLPIITYDIEAKEIYSNMYKRSKKELKFLGYIYENFKETANGVAYLKVSKEILEKYDMDYVKAVRMVNALKGCEGIKNWHFFVENPQTLEIMCEFRSSGPRVNDIAAKYGGGGHMLAAGATVSDWNVVDRIIIDFDNNCK